MTSKPKNTQAETPETTGTQTTAGTVQPDTTKPAATTQAKPADIPAKKETRVSDTLTEIGRKILKSHPGKTCIFMTTDGTPFFAETDARNHAKTLSDNKVIPVKK